MISKPNFFDQPVNNRWSIRAKLKSGGFGSVYLARDLKDKNKIFAIKLSPAEGKKFAEIQEKMYSLIQRQQFTNGFIKYYQTGDFMKYRYLVMELVGKDLDQMKKVQKSQKFSIKTVLMIGLQVIDRLQALHKIGYIHRDVKPDNLAVGLQQKNKVIYLFDFGLALPIGSQIPKDEKGKIVGTLGFMSCRGHQGKPQGPSDDVQSLIYTLLYLAEGQLPWIKLKVQTPADFHKIHLMKRGLSKKSFRNQNISRQFFQLINQIQNKKASDRVDYLKIKYKLLQMLKEKQEENDFRFDWCGNTTRKDSVSPKSKQKGRYLSPQDSPNIKKKKEQMNQENQKIVQNQIYQVYKFMDDGKQKNKKKQKDLQKLQPKGIREVKRSPKKEKLQQKKVQKKVRPSSAANRPKQDENKKMWDKFNFFESTNAVLGPKIVINKTAKHKI